MATLYDFIRGRDEVEPIDCTRNPQFPLFPRAESEPPSRCISVDLSRSNASIAQHVENTPLRPGLDDSRRLWGSSRGAASRRVFRAYVICRAEAYSSLARVDRWRARGAHGHYSSIRRRGVEASFDIVINTSHGSILYNVQDKCPRRRSAHFYLATTVSASLWKSMRDSSVHPVRSTSRSP